MGRSPRWITQFSHKGRRRQCPREVRDDSTIYYFVFRLLKLLEPYLNIHALMLKNFCVVTASQIYIEPETNRKF